MPTYFILTGLVLAARDGMPARVAAGVLMRRPDKGRVHPASTSRFAACPAVGM